MNRIWLQLFSVKMFLLSLTMDYDKIAKCTLELVRESETIRVFSIFIWDSNKVHKWRIRFAFISKLASWWEYIFEFKLCDLSCTIRPICTFNAPEKNLYLQCVFSAHLTTMPCPAINFNQFRSYFKELRSPTDYVI